MSNLLGLGGTTTSQKATRYIGIPIQTSIKGNSIPRGWGTFKGGCNLLDYLDFISTAHDTKTGGKGGSYQSVDYSYTATLLLGLCQGPIAGIRKVYRDQSIFVTGGTTALAQAGLSLATGAIGQAVWGYLTTSHPTHAIGYSGLAYVYAQGYGLNSSATLQNHSFEIQSTVRAVISGFIQDDANPKDIIIDVFSDLPRWPAGVLDVSTYAYGDYCLAAGLLLSPFLDSQRQISDFLKEILQASNSDCVWSDGTLKIIPYGDTAITGNGVTWTPDLTPKYALTWDSFLAPDGEDPIKWDFTRPSTAYNYVQVEFTDRTNNYVSDVMPAYDQANIDQYGPCKQDPTSLNSIKDPVVAASVAQLMVQRTCNVRRTGTLELPETFGLLDPMDTITVPLRNGGTRYVRITDYEEKPDTASIIFTVEEMLVGIGHAALYARQAASAITQNLSVDPGDAAAPIVMDVPVQLSAVIGLETWIAVTSATSNPYWGGCEVHISSDNVSYAKAKTIVGSSRMGVTTATFASGSDPDTTHTLSVDLSSSSGSLDSGTTSDADAGTTLCFVDGEYVAFSTANLTSAFNYNLTSYIRRGFWGSQIASHASGSLFVRLDDYTCKLPYNATDVGRTIYIKLLSFNVYGLALQQLSAVSPTTHVIGGPPTFYAPNTLTASPAVKGIQLNWVNAHNVGQAAVEIWRSPTSSFAGASKIADTPAYANTYNDQITASSTPYWYWIRARDIAGNPSVYTPSTGGAGATATSGQAATADIATNAVTEQGGISPTSAVSTTAATVGSVSFAVGGGATVALNDPTTGFAYTFISAFGGKLAFYSCQLQSTTGATTNVTFQIEYGAGASGPWTCAPGASQTYRLSATPLKLGVFLQGYIPSADSYIRITIFSDNQTVNILNPQIEYIVVKK